nr:hypothetical protein Q903MT_gene3696 [Picea sitchensis]
MYGFAFLPSHPRERSNRYRKQPLTIYNKVIPFLLLPIGWLMAWLI